MLDERLDADERRALLFLLTSVALTDGKLSDSEVRFVQRLALPIGVEVGELLAWIDATTVETQCARLQRPVAARIAVLELLRLAHVDDVYAHVEQSAIHEIARRLGVPRDLVEQMEDWVHDESTMNGRARRLIDG